MAAKKDINNLKLGLLIAALEGRGQIQYEKFDDELDSAIALLKENLLDVKPKEYELNYRGKKRASKVLSDTVGAPLQLVKTYGKTDKKNKWSNKLILGDNLKVLKQLTTDNEVSGKVNLVYIDPPFATKQDFKKGQEKAYTDKVIGAEFVEFIRERLILIKELMADDAVIYVHLDEKKSHYIKVILDEVFGEENFQREIIWDISVLSGFKTQAANWVRGHDVLLYYSKSANFIFNKLTTEHRQEYLDRFNKVDKDGRKYFDGRGEKKYLEDVISKGKRIGDVWNDIMSFQQIPTSKEKIGYPTQKPENLLERIILSSSRENDLVLDAFAGSGTTIAVAEKLNRRWIGIDCGKLSLYSIQSRMLNLKSEIGNKGKSLPTKPFGVYNAGLYDYEAINRLSEIEYREFIMELFGIRAKPHSINGIEMDGIIDGQSVLVWKHTQKDLVINNEYLDNLVEVISGKSSKVLYLVAPNSVFSFAEDRRKVKDVEFRFLRIPQSIIEELIRNEGKSLKQPISEGNVNDIVDALSFDFIRIPTVKYKTKITNPNKSDLFNSESKCLRIEIEEFLSNAAAAALHEENQDSLALILFDDNYNGNEFNLTDFIFAKDIKSQVVEFEIANVSQSGMIIFVDVYGNEFRDLLDLTKISKSKS